MGDFYQKYHQVFDIDAYNNNSNVANMRVSEPNYVFDLNRVPLRNMAPFSRDFGAAKDYSVLPFIQNDIYKKQYESPPVRARSKSKEPIAPKIGAYSPVILRNKHEIAHGMPTGARMSPLPSQRRILYPNAKQTHMKEMLYF